jgi:hypothetical protein
VRERGDGGEDGGDKGRSVREEAGDPGHDFAFVQGWSDVCVEASDVCALYRELRNGVVRTKLVHEVITTHL